ncbi:MAG: hypothetical protein NT013_18405 [Planctomycetia bacterium]|nr:hypothetical protein [Planctomycetia bacterium]
MKLEPSVFKPDPVIAELHRIKDDHAKKFNYDVRAMMADLRERQKTSSRTYVSFSKTSGQATDEDTVAATKHN